MRIVVDLTRCQGYAQCVFLLRTGHDHPVAVSDAS